MESKRCVYKQQPKQNNTKTKNPNKKLTSNSVFSSNTMEIID